MFTFIPNAGKFHKMWCVWAALVILVLNIAAIALPVISSHISPTQLALINAGLAAAVPFLRVLQQQGIITETDVPGLSAITGVVQTTGPATVTMTDTSVKIESEAPAVPVAKPEGE